MPSTPAPDHIAGRDLRSAESSIGGPTADGCAIRRRRAAVRPAARSLTLRDGLADQHCDPVGSHR